MGKKPRVMAVGLAMLIGLAVPLAMLRGQTKGGGTPSAASKGGKASVASVASDGEPKAPGGVEKGPECKLTRIEGKLQPVNGKSVVVFKTTPQGNLKINLFFPKDWKEGDHRPGIVFFFGGGMAFGDTSQFTMKCEYFAGRGMVAAAPEYRISSKHHTEPEIGLADTRSAIRWLRMNAGSLGIDPQRIVAGGSSSGAWCAMIPAYNNKAYVPPGEDPSVSSRPDAVVLYYGGGPYGPCKGYPQGSNYTVTPHGPPVIMFIGTEDGGVAGCRDLLAQMTAAGNRCELYTAKGQKHGFCGAAAPGGDNPWQDLVLEYTDRFLASLGYLKGEPTISVPAGKKVTLTKESPASPTAAPAPAR